MPLIRTESKFTGKNKQGETINVTIDNTNTITIENQTLGDTFEVSKSTLDLMQEATRRHSANKVQRN